MTQDSHILIIDDDEPIRTLLSVVLQDQGYSVDLADNAADGLELARARTPDLVLCDLNMPGTSGLDLLHMFRRDAALAECRFLIMTGNPNRELLDNPDVLNGHAYLAKPFDLAELQKRLKDMFQTC